VRVERGDQVLIAAITTHFLTRTLDKVQTEMSLHVLAYNLKRMIRVFGVGPLPGAVAEQEPPAAGSTRGEDAIARLDLVRMRDKGGFDADALQRGRHDGSGTGSLKMLPSQRREIVT
jgi:hypothetical protein